MKKKTLIQISLEVPIDLRKLYQDKDMWVKKFLKLHPKFSKVTKSKLRNTKKLVAEKNFDNRKYGHGRKKKISPRD